MKGLRFLFSLTTFFVLLFSCSNDKIRENYIVKRHLIDNASRNLVAILEVNTPGFYLENGRPTGYHYEMLKAYAQSRGYQLQVKPFTTADNARNDLLEGKADIIAAENCNFDGKGLSKSVPHWKIYFSIISFSNRKADAKDKIYLPNNILSQEDVKNLSTKFPNIGYYDGLNTGLLVEHLHHAPSSYAIVQAPVAAAIKSKNPDIHVEVFNESISNSWFISPKFQNLFDLNTWLASTRNSVEHSRFYSSFYQNFKVNRWIAEGVSLTGNFVLSEYDQLVKSYSERIGWDWLLVSALIYQESQFKPKVVSHKGAVGLMQVMPSTANLFGYDSQHSPTTNVYLGTRLLSRLTKAFERYPIPVEERSKFVLASYNGGIGHILDAMKLAQKYGDNPYHWAEVAKFLKLKRNPAYYNDKVVKFGVFYDSETTRFVNDILERYQSYKALSFS